jgi:hypothetical protein
MWMWLLVIAAVLVVLVGWRLLHGRAEMSNRGALDRLRRRDPDTAARIEAQRADQALRGFGANGGVGPYTGGFGG